MALSEHASAVDQHIGAKSTGVADRNTPLIRDCWYVAAFAEEITREPLRRTILDHDIVFYRKADGGAVAMQNRCPHRSFPLHTGQVKGDRITCGYHGIEFNSDGSCAHIPALNSAPKAVRLQAYPLVESYPLLWIWMGDSDSPDHGLLPRLEWCESPDWKSVRGYFHLGANYLGLHENLMDVSHFPFLHAKWNISDPDAAGTMVAFEDSPVGVVQSQRHDDVFVSPTYVAGTGMTAPFRRKIRQSVWTPALHKGENTTTDSAHPPVNDVWHIDHMITPESQSTTHYFWSIARDKIVDDATIDAEFEAMANGAFAEDKVALENIEQLMKRDKRPGFREKILRTDEGGIKVLRMFAKMASGEVAPQVRS